PAIALTAFARLEDEQRALSGGFDAHLAKPIVADRLVAVVASLATRPPTLGADTMATPVTESTPGAEAPLVESPVTLIE
ncbi:MAG: hypothetical protein ABI051_04765, partial [Vicinamibacterales bacterium]